MGRSRKPVWEQSYRGFESLPLRCADWSPALTETQGDPTMTVGFDKPLYILPFDHRGSFQTKMFGWTGTLSREQTAHIAAAKRVIYDSVRAGATDVPRNQAGILVDEQFGGSILRDAAAQ